MSTTITRIAVEEPEITITELQSYIRIQPGSRDEELKSALSAATAKVEHRINKSLRKQTIELCTFSGQSGDVELYFQPAAEIISVESQDTGELLSYTKNTLLKSIRTTPMTEVRIVYKTNPAPYIDHVKMAILATTALIFSGDTDEANFRAIFKRYL